MDPKNDDLSYTIPKMYALAAKLEGEGQYNNVKLVRAAAEAICRQAAFKMELSPNNSELSDELKRISRTISENKVSAYLAKALMNGAKAMTTGQLPLIDETPNPFVCRTCGHVILDEPETDCPVCAARPQTFQKFPPVYWLTNMDPFEALDRLRQTPKDVSAILYGLTEEESTRVPDEGEWSIHNAVSHLRDAQELFEFRLNLMIEEENPKLESKAVFEWVAQDEERPPSTAEISKIYAQSRQRVLTTLEKLPLEDWWRTGEHEEFGTLTITQQVSYFATHELTHFPQIEALISQST
jgi:rubrerythrin/uncharacterized damage-inducible protein DinB